MRASKPLVLLLVVFTISRLSSVTLAAPADDSPDAGPTPPAATPPQITLAKDATFVTGPLKENGYVNYHAALNERLSKGITVENNAAIPLIRAMGSAPEGRPLPDQFFKRLGIEPLPHEGEYLIDLVSFAKREAAGRIIPRPVDTAKLLAQYDKAIEQPWVAEDAPQIARCLKANERPLALVAEAVERPRLYQPWTTVGENDWMIAQSLPIPQRQREIARQLQTRAMLRLGEGDIEGAWHDLLTLQRLARLVAQGPTVIEWLVGSSIDTMSNAGVRTLAIRGKLTAQQALRMQRKLSELPPLPPVADRFDQCERMMLLDTTLVAARDGLGILEFGGHEAKDPILTVAALGEFEWDDVLRQVNRWMDRMVTAARLPTYADRKAALADFEKDVASVQKFVDDLPKIAKSFPMDIRQPKKWIAERIGDILAITLMPAAQGCVALEERVHTHADVTRVTIALAAYRADHQQYPDSLEKLVPKYIAKLPQDAAGDDLRYDADHQEFLLRAADPNGFDIAVVTPGRAKAE